MKFCIAILILTLLSACTTMPESGPLPNDANHPTKESIRQTIRAHIKDIRKCYEAELETNPKLEGKLVLKWEIDDKGRVTKTQIDERSTLKSQPLSECISECVKTWNFLASPAGMTKTVTYPFLFNLK